MLARCAIRNGSSPSATSRRRSTLLTAAGELHAAGRISGRLGILESALWVEDDAGRCERIEEAFRTVAGDEPDADVAELASHAR